MTQELKPCPFCGTAPAPDDCVGPAFTVNFKRRQRFVSCGSCGAQGPSSPVDLAKHEPIGETTGPAIAAWNTRPTSTAPSQVPAHPADMREAIVDERAVKIARRHHGSYDAHPTLYSAAYEAARAAFATSAIDGREESARVVERFIAMTEASPFWEARTTECLRQIPEDIRALGNSGQVG